jgi:TRAP-type C4-dicarboxylate transport system substrate-binding protein
LAAQDELKDIKLLGLFTHGPGQIFTSRHGVKNLQDNGGVKGRGGGVAATRVIEALGMTAVQAPITQASEMLANRIVDGFAMDPAGISTFGFYDYADSRFTVDGGLYNVSFFVGMNSDTWTRLSPQDKAAIEAISGAALARRAGEWWQGTIDDAYDDFERRGYALSKPEGDFARELQAVFAGFEEDWITTVAKNGIDGRIVLDAYRAEVARLSVDN